MLSTKTWRRKRFMLSKLRDARTALAGIAGGMMVAVFSLRGGPGLNDALDDLRDGAMLLVMLCIALSLLEFRFSKRR